MKWKKSLGLSFLILGVCLLVLSGTHPARADSFKDVTVSAVGKDWLGQVVVTEKLRESWEYDGNKIKWNSTPTYTLVKAWWLAWGYFDGTHTGIKVIQPGRKNMAYGTTHYHAGIPVPYLGVIGINQDLYINLYFYYNGVYWSESGYGYET